MKRKIATLNAISEKGLARLREPFELTGEAQRADAWIVRSAGLHAVEFPDNLRAIARAGAGVNNIPLERASEAGIVVFNTPGANANGVRELVLCAMILSSRDIIGGTHWVRKNEDLPDIATLAEKVKGQFAGTEIRHKTLGVIGLGAVGHLVANAAIGVGMNVEGYDPAIPLEYALQLSTQVHMNESLEELLPKCDYISIHVPLTNNTQGMIGTKEIALMKNEAILLNFARDLICDEKEVGLALRNEKLRGYVVDFPNEHNVTFPRTIVTPHIGATTVESEEQCAVMAVEALQNYLAYGNIVHSVNFPDVNLGILRAPSRIVLLHRNVPGTLNRMTALFGEHKYNIEQMVSASRGAYSVALFDIDGSVSRDFISHLQDHDEILKLRLIHREVSDA